MTVQTAPNTHQVVSPVPRGKWRSVLAGDPLALPEHSPDWVDALTDGGRYRDASRLYSFSDGREAILPLVRRRGLAGIGGWLLSYPSGWGMGGLVGAGIDGEVARAVLEDLREQHWQRVAIRPDPRRWQAWAEALDANVLTIPRRVHIIDLGGGVDSAWHGMSNSTRRHVRNAERHGVRIETGHSGALLRDYYSLFLASVDRWAEQQHEPRALAHARAKLRDPLAKLQSIGRHLGEGFLVTLAYVDGKPAAGSITLYGRTAHYTRSAMDRELVGRTGAGELVQWTAIKLACERGCTVYNMGESGQSAALAQFKEKFGARPFDYAELRLDRLPWTRADAALRRAVKRILGFRDV
ncbi:GNAT family N-acetyltransferase [Paeniglutamicibacter sp. NPDC012692]|uniref:GNAT family N-acetyltransferase n=1 Tax=Paeniglutamicibacter sp. NPDC012692 TaxID=3364388 RepID=UPI0036B8F570